MSTDHDKNLEERIAAMTDRAVRWLTRLDHQEVTRANAIGEENMALDILDLLASRAELKERLEKAKQNIRTLIKCAGLPGDDPRWEEAQKEITK